MTWRYRLCFENDFCHFLPKLRLRRILSFECTFPNFTRGYSTSFTPLSTYILFLIFNFRLLSDCLLITGTFSLGLFTSTLLFIILSITSTMIRFSLVNLLSFLSTSLSVLVSYWLLVTRGYLSNQRFLYKFCNVLDTSFFIKNFIMYSVTLTWRDTVIVHFLVLNIKTPFITSKIVHITSSRERKRETESVCPYVCVCVFLWIF